MKTINFGRDSFNVSIDVYEELYEKAKADEAASYLVDIKKVVGEQAALLSNGLSIAPTVESEGSRMFLVTLNLPYANNQWSLDAFTLARKLTELYPGSYIVHGEGYVKHPNRSLGVRIIKP